MIPVIDRLNRDRVGIPVRAESVQKALSKERSCLYYAEAEKIASIGAQRFRIALNRIAI
jgi:hypothetical protein